MATRKSSSAKEKQATEDQKTEDTKTTDTAPADGAIDVQGTETVTETPVSDVTAPDSEADKSGDASDGTAASETPDPDADTSDASEDDGPSEEQVSTARGIAEKCLIPVVPEDQLRELDVSSLTAVVNPQRSGIDGIIRVTETKQTIFHIDYGEASATLDQIKSDLKSLGFTDNQIDTQGA